MSEEDWKERFAGKVDKLAEYAHLFTDKEQNFIDSMQIRISNEKKITWPMHKWITDIYAKCEDREWR